MNIKQYLLVLLLPFIFVACTTPQIIETTDPNLKLDQAQQLFGSNDPLRAEKLLHHALIIYREQGNKTGEAEVYRRLGLYYSSDQYHENANHYKQQKTYDAGGVKALNYLKKADFLFQKTGNFYESSITNYLVAMVYKTWGNRKAACGYLLRASNLNKDRMIEKPKHYRYLPDAYNSYEEFIEESSIPNLDCEK